MHAMNIPLCFRFFQYYLMQALFSLGLCKKCFQGHESHADSRYCDVCGHPAHRLTLRTRARLRILYWKEALGKIPDRIADSGIARFLDGIFFPADANPEALPTYHTLLVALLVGFAIVCLVGIVFFAAVW